MPKKNRLESRTKKKLLLNAEELFGALDIELSEEQKETIAIKKTANEIASERTKALLIIYREELNAKDREYYAANREEINAKNRAYRREHGEEVRAKDREYYAANCDKIQATRRAYRAKNRDKINAYQRAYYAEHREAHHEERKARDREAWRKKMQDPTTREEYNAKRRAYYAAKKARQSGELVGGQNSRFTSCANDLSERT